MTIAADTVDDMDNQTSLREAVAYAGTLSGADTVTFAPGLNGATIAMTSGTSLSGDVDGITIDATALANGLTIQSNATSRAVLNTGILTLLGLKLTGAALTGGQAGGAVFSSGTLELDRCTLTGNSADFGGGAIFNGGILTVRRCTITGNSSGGHAGAIYNNAGTLTVVNSTITANTSGTDFSIYNNATATLRHCAFAGNIALLNSGSIYNAPSKTMQIENCILGQGNTGVTDLVNDGNLTFIGANLAEKAPVGGVVPTGPAPVIAAPMLAALGNNGGPTQTMKLLAGSPAIDAAVSSTEAIDQRGVTRPRDGDGIGGSIADIGAMEVANTNADLSGLVLSTGTLTPSFSSATTSYLGRVGAGVSSITVTPTVLAPSSTVTVNGVPVVSGAASGSIAVGPEDSVIQVVVTADDPFIVKTYSISIRQVTADLSNLTVSAGPLTPAFQSSTLGYSLTVANETTSTTVTATLGDPLSTLTVNGSTASSGVATSPINLNVGNNTIQVVTTSQDGTLTRTYTVGILRQGNPRLSSLALGGATFLPAFDPDTTSYLANVDRTVNSVTVTPTAVQGNASITVNSVPLGSGVTSGPVPLVQGLNVITIAVSAPEGPVTRIYTVNVVKPYVVTNSYSSGSGSLEAVIAAADADPYRDTILFEPYLNGTTIYTSSSSARIYIVHSLTIDASNLPNGITFDRLNQGNIMYLAGADYEIRNLKFTNGRGIQTSSGAALTSNGNTTLVDCEFFANGPSGGTGYGAVLEGGAIYNAGILVMERCVVRQNSAYSFGGGIYQEGAAKLTMRHCTVSGNFAHFAGGGIYSSSSGGVFLTHCTVSNNSVDDGANGGGIYLYGANANLELKHSIFSGNFGTPGPDIAAFQGTVKLLGNNIVHSAIDGTVDSTNGSYSQVDPKLSLFDYFGGPTPLFVLGAGSPAINAATGSTATYDQRGFPIVGVPDLGSYEAGTYTNSYVYLTEKLPVGASAAERDYNFDYDKDGKTNGEEWLALTDPNNPNSRFEVTSFVPNGNAFDVTLPTALGRHYLIETSPTMTNGTWTPVGTGFDGTGGIVTTPIGPFSGEPRMFVRVQVSVSGG
ncbi:MAG: cadherin-like beta sandwich domain-containing protein [Verrucomicrobiaceae bacterium]